MARRCGVAGVGFVDGRGEDDAVLAATVPNRSEAVSLHAFCLEKRVRTACRGCRHRERRSIGRVFERYDIVTQFIDDLLILPI
jgi:hypothetical protein